MMDIIAHRRNTIEELCDTPRRYGVEVDIRSSGKTLIVAHDPFVDGIEFEEWISHYNHKILILNTKEEGLEQRLLQVMKNRDINTFFFLDQSFPFLVKTAKTGERRCAVRISEYESVETALSLKGLIDWVWVDIFSQLALTREQAHTLKSAGFKLCLVSPELQGRWDDAEIKYLKKYLREADCSIDAVCTKTPEQWL